MKFRSIRSRLIQFMLLATTIPLLLSISITYIHTKETIKEQALEENRHLIFQGKTNLSNYLDNINKASLVVYNDANFLRNLRKIPEDYRAVAEVFTLLQNIQNTVSGIERIYLHASQSNQSTLVTPATFPKREFRPVPYVSTVPYEKFTTAVEPTHNSHDYGFPVADLAYEAPGVHLPPDDHQHPFGKGAGGAGHRRQARFRLRPFANSCLIKRTSSWSSSTREAASFIPATTSKSAKSCRIKPCLTISAKTSAAILK
ncbi:hypothetical protein VQ056_20980 [Paenibacillus sp. JTLBN-2024]